MESMGEMKTLLNHSSDALLISDPKGKILYVNPSIEHVSGLSVNTHLGRNIRHLIGEKLISNSATLESLETGKIVTREVSTAAGKQLINTASPVLNSLGRLERVVCNIRSLKVYSAKKNNSLNFDCYESRSQERDFPYRVVQIQGGDFEIVLNSEKMRQVEKLALKMRQVDSTVIITGETGVGKELIARYIHSCSPRENSGAFIKVNCASFPPNLIESELFGYEPGAFTGALRNGKTGFFEMADKGTLFLDEIAELSLDMQAKLLGVLQDKQLFKVGGTRLKMVDVRIIAATNKNLEQMVKEGRFREDLFYRLNVVPIEVPPLRERVEDIPALILYFSRKLQEKYSLNKAISPDLMKYLAAYPWPGNVRELNNLIERLLITVSESSIKPTHLSGLYTSGYSSSSISKENSGNLKEMLDEFEMDLVKKAVEQCETRTETAELLGISLSSLTRKLRRLKMA
ncbi:MAG: sigma 54-interacting transcriptional regulator [Bacillota bacterium]|nr:sigma 54-interacting transcriptional regulator [Bacillota bacterium]